MAPRLELRKLANDSSIGLLRQGWTLLLGILISILLARGLGTTNRGIYTLVLLFPELIITFMNLGVMNSTVYFIGNKTFTPETALRENLNLAVWISTISVIIGSLIMVLFPDQLFPNVDSKLLFLSLLVIPISLLTSYLQAIFQGLEDFQTFNLVSVIAQFALLVLVFLLVWVFKWSIYGAILAYLFSNWIGLFYVFFFLKRKLGLKLTLSLRLNITYIRKIIAYTLKTHLNNIISFLNYRVDNFILVILSGASFVGLYSVSVGLSERLWIISTAVGAVIFARISTLEEGDERREKITPITTRFVLWLSIIIALVAAPLLIVLIPILYSNEYVGAIIPLLLLLPGTVTYNVGRVLANDIAGRGKPEINLLQSIVALIINIICNLLLIPRFNASGAAIASTISYSIWAILTMRIYLRLSKVPFHETVIPTISDFHLLYAYLTSTLWGLKKWLERSKTHVE